MLASGLLMAGVLPVEALDTTKSFDPGVSNAELYLGYGGVGVGAEARELSSEMLLGYGLTPRLSAYLGTCTAVAEQSLRGGTDLCFGVFGTPVDSDHLDLDLILAMEASGAALGDLGLSPGFELNYDVDPQMASWGVYLRGAVAAYGGETGSDASVRRILDLELNPGAYLRLSERVQVLLEFNRVFGLGDGRSANEGARGVALGLNTLISPTIELITQLQRSATIGGEPSA